MKLTFIGADHEVTGSCHLLQAGAVNLMVDYGMEQGVNVYENAELPVSCSAVNYVLLTHAHIDHAGLLPLLYARGFRGKIYATPATCELCNIMLKDSAHIQETEAEWKNRKGKRAGKGEVEPLYTVNDAVGVLQHFVPCGYGEKVAICDEITVRFIDVGHLLGSASIEVWATEENVTKKIVFSGDIGNFNKPLIRDPQYIHEADYILTEATYGDRFHHQGKDHLGELARIIQYTLDRGGNVVIPAFAVGRTQELLYYIRRIKTEGLVTGHENFDVYVDSPLAVEATHVFHNNMMDCFDEETRELVRCGINPISFPGLRLSVTSDESVAINFDTKPKVIISAAGMCDAGRIRHHLKHNLWRKESTVVFAGYQAEGTLGRLLTDGVKEVKIFGEPIEVEATIECLDGMSGHADQNGLLKWMGAFENTPQQVFVVHGESTVCDLYAEKVTQEFGFPASAPYSGSEYDLKAGCWLKETEGIPINKAQEATRRATGIFARLMAAVDRLKQVVLRNEGGTNKDLAKFADQINSLCDKWDRQD